jgi:hypothetical protein
VDPTQVAAQEVAEITNEVDACNKDFIVNRSTAVGQFEPGQGFRLFEGTPVARGDEFDIPKSAGVVMPPSAFKAGAFHSFLFQLNLSSSVHLVTQPNS